MITIVTGLTLLDDTITATRFGAGVAATIVVHLVAVIASFHTETHDAVATAGRDATGYAVIIISSVAIVALFKAKFTFAKVIAEDAVAAAGKLTVVSAAIVFHGVAVITLLVAFGLGIVQTAGGPIAAAGEKATVGAGVRGDLVPIIAFFIGLDLSIATFAGDISDHHLFAGTGGEKEEADEAQV